MLALPAADTALGSIPKAVCVFKRNNLSEREEGHTKRPGPLRHPQKPPPAVLVTTGRTQESMLGFWLE